MVFLRTLCNWSMGKYSMLATRCPSQSLAPSDGYTIYDRVGCILQRAEGIFLFPFHTRTIPIGIYLNHGGSERREV